MHGRRSPTRGREPAYARLFEARRVQGAGPASLAAGRAVLHNIRRSPAPHPTPYEMQPPLSRLTYWACVCIQVCYAAPPHSLVLMG